MDEQRLAELFHAAVREVPPPTFGSDDVVAASRRATGRRRTALAGGALLGVAVLAGGALVTGQLLPGDTADMAGSGQASAPTTAEAPAVRPFTLLPAPGPGPRSAPGVACGPADGALAAQVRTLIMARGIEPAGPEVAVPEPCPAGSRSVAIPVDGGTLAVLVVPVAGQPEPVEITRPDGGGGYALALADGRGLAVFTSPGVAGQPAPYLERLPELARSLAERL